MPLISKSDYNPMFLFSNAHFQTIYPPLFRKVKGVNYVRERILTPDRDFIDLDWSKVGADRAVIVSHGLEGHSRRSYVLGMIKAFNTRGWDGIAFNFRGCSGEPNRLIRSYHCGATEDLHTVVSHVIEKKSYSSISLVGFSVGGNLTLMYLGEKNILFLKACYPLEEARNNPYLFFEMPKSGGHVGFVDFKSNAEYWHETKIAAFAANNL